MTDTETRIQQTARRLWEADGKPEGREEIYRDLATEIVAQKETYLSTTLPVDETRDTEQPAETLENLGEFPTLTDQSEMEVPRCRTGGQDTP
ncbi:MAG: hypothetical protein B7X99_15635 [Rhizobiales bacterium 17-65-6]|nr:MAG: hypothetical protein B7Z30_06020 [Rhizobiales bacterium 12-68-15]OYX83886.1 MAG: hypothetical protein B7Y84_17665 [Azorhizobium sp. 32-67-21]OYZ93292.1 MAG: hypothetical protein B7X99_15635 [Rhizobiales bacterium 17-65-6]